VLAAAAPLALALSHPAVFVAGGIGVALGARVCRAFTRRVVVAYAAFLLSTVASFAVLYLTFTRPQAAATLSGMSTQWVTGFPPLGDPLALGRWLIRVHTGSIFAYPCGGERGASALTSLAFLVGAVVLWRRGQRTILALCLGPFGAALFAAALRRYPYGGVTHGSPARIMQFLAPAICLLAGLGAARVLAWFPSPGLRRRGLRLGVVALVAIGIVPLASDATHPYRSIQAERARQFAREFWPNVAHDCELVCMRWDLGLGNWDSTDLNVAVYLCNQKIYSPRRRAGPGPRWDAVSEARPLRCVESLAGANDQRVGAWLESMRAQYDLRSRREIVVDIAEAGARARIERYRVYEFVPASGEPIVGSAGIRLPRR
jgi:hypothetical protein